MLDFREIDTYGVEDLEVVKRAKVPGGWLVIIQVPDTYGFKGSVSSYKTTSLTFMPDPDHKWEYL